MLAKSTTLIDETRTKVNSKLEPLREMLDLGFVRT